MEPIKIYCSKNKSWRSIGIAAFFAVLATGCLCSGQQTYYFGGGILIFLTLLCLVGALRSLVLNHPYCTLDHQGLRMRSFFGMKMIPWSSVTEIVPGYLPTGRSRLPALIFQTREKPRYLPMSPLAETIEELIQKMSANSEFANLYARANEKAPGAFADLAARMSKANVPTPWWKRLGLRLAGFVCLFVLLVVIGYMNRNKPSSLIRAAERATVNYCKVDAKLLEGCFDVTPLECKSTLSHAVSLCGDATKKMFEGRPLDPKVFRGRLVLCAYKSYYAVYQTRLVATHPSCKTTWDQVLSKN